MQDYYAARATEYDTIYSKPERQADLRQIERWLPGVFTGRSVLEIACGTGYWTQFFPSQCTRVLAIDASPETIRVARTRVPARKVEFIVSDAYNLPLQAELFDGGFAGFWWSHVPRARQCAFLDGFHARLEPGASVVLLDNRFVPDSSSPISEQDGDGNTYQTRRLSDRSSHRILKNFPSRQELINSVSPFASTLHYREWEYFWALEYTTAAP